MTPQTHSARPSLFGKETTYRTTETALTIETEGGTVEIPYSDVTQVRLITYGGFDGVQAQTTVHSKSGTKARIRSHHYYSLNNFENRGATYSSLVRDLVRRVATANPGVRLVAGAGTGVRIAWWAILIPLVVMGAVMGLVGLLALVELLGFIEVSADDPADWGMVGVAAVILCMLAAIVPVAWNGARKSRESVIDPDNPPTELLELEL